MTFVYGVLGHGHGALKAIMNAQGRTPRGVHPAELAVCGPDYAAVLRKPGFDLHDDRRGSLAMPETTPGDQHADIKLHNTED